MGKVAVIRKRMWTFFFSKRRETVRYVRRDESVLNIVENRVLGDDLGLRGKK
jgi:hypothetical protein